VFAEVDELAAETDFSGVVRVDREGDLVDVAAYGMAHRAARVANTADTRFGIASGTKALTALTVVSLIDDGVISLATTARSLLGDDLPLIADDVTVEHLLAHRSGIGDYLDEDTHRDPNDYVLPIPLHELATTEPYVPVLDGHPMKFAAGTAFSYCNSGYVLLALLVERATQTPFHELVGARVIASAGMHATAFLRSDDLPSGAALGYLDATGNRTNVLHLPVCGSGDGGIYTTAADVHALWAALLAGRIVSHDWLEEMHRPRSDVPAESSRYGLGFWLDAITDTVMFHGCDAGVSFRTVYAPSHGVTHTVLANTTNGAWPITRRLDELLLE
jgi:CubicO group peptidase (beta-lactamase class C family)